MYRKGEVSYQPLPLPDRVVLADPLIAAESHLAFMRRRHSVRQYADRPVPEGMSPDEAARLLDGVPEGSPRVRANRERSGGRDW